MPASARSTAASCVALGKEPGRFFGAAAALSTVSLWHLLVGDRLEYSELHSFQPPDLGLPRARQ
jgi:hypothetical protein